MGEHGYGILMHMPCENALGNVYLSSLTKNSSAKNVSNLILAVEVRCHKVQGMTEAFFDSIIPGEFICSLAREKQ